VLAFESMKYIVMSEVRCSFENCTLLQDSSKTDLRISTLVFLKVFHIDFKLLEKVADE